MNTKTNTSSIFPAATGAVALLFFVFAAPAEAKIVVQGDRQFTDDVNNCLSTYRNTPGLVGDVIKELERSGNEHRIVDDPAWENSPNNAENAENGTGTGTVSKVNKPKFEEWKAEIEELKNKDFCTTLMHELFHAVDADRGEWSQEKVEGIYKDEVGATMFQNLLHALRGVLPRTTYGTADLVKLGLMEAPVAAPVGKTIKAISYRSKFLPVDQLIIEGEPGCGADHWHAAQGIVTATDGTKVSDPGPQCGYGKVSDLPAKDVPAPKSAPAGSGASSGVKIEVRGLDSLKTR